MGACFISGGGGDWDGFGGSCVFILGSLINKSKKITSDTFDTVCDTVWIVALSCLSLVVIVVGWMMVVLVLVAFVG